MNESENTKRPLPLRARYPKLYDIFVAKLEDEHLHAYDARAVMTNDGDQVTITVLTGENFEKRMESSFTHEQIENIDDSLVQFISEAVDKCKEIVKDDYRIFMKVQP